MVWQKTNHVHIHSRLHTKYLDQLPIPHPPKSIICIVQIISETIWGKGPIRKIRRQYAGTFSSRYQTPETKDRKPIILWEIHGHSVTGCTNHPGVCTIPWNRSNGYRNCAAIKLLCCASGRSHLVKTKLYYPCNPQWCLIIVWAESAQFIMQALLLK